jgi:hypothetical protein
LFHGSGCRLFVVPGSGSKSRRPLKNFTVEKKIEYLSNVANPDPGSGDFFTPSSRIRDGTKIQIWDPGFRMNIPDHIYKSFSK